MEKKNIFKKIALLAMCSACLGCATYFVGCKDKTPTSEEEPKVEFALDKKAVQTTLYQTFSLKATMENIDESVQWKSLDENVVHVDNAGNATALGVGETKIVASVGELSAECLIVVSPTTQVPVLSATNLLDENISMEEKGSFTPNLEMLFDGVAQKNVEFTFESLNANIVTVEQGALKANAVGECQVKVTAKLCGKTLTDVTKVFTVRVVKAIDLQLSHAALKLYAVENLGGESYATTQKLTCAVFDGGEALENPALTWSVVDEAVASVSADGTVQALQCGKTEVQVQYGDFVKKLPLVVDYAIAEKAGEVLIAKTSTEALDPMDIFGEAVAITKVYDVTDGEDISKLTPIDVKTTSATGTRTYLFCNAKYAVKTQVLSADYVISTVEDVLNIPKIASGYVVLANNIVGVGSYNAARVQNVFSGTFDGRGYSISGLKYTKDQYPLFHKTNGATIKNLGLIDVSIMANQTAGLAYGNEGVTNIDNVQIVIKETTSTHDHFLGGVYASVTSGAILMQNSLVHFMTDSVDKKGALIGRSNVLPSITNCYFITNAPLCTDFASSNQMKESINALGIDYASAEAFTTEREKEGSKIDLSGFNAYWDLNRYEVPVLKSYQDAYSAAISLKGLTEAADDAFISKAATTVELDVSAQSLSEIDLFSVGGKTITNYTYASGKISFAITELSGVASGESAVLYGNSTQGYYKKTAYVGDVVLSTAADVKAFVENPVANIVFLEKDIDMNGIAIAVNNQDVFRGVFDGLGNKLYNIRLTGDRGLIYQLDGGTIKNLVVQGTVAGNQGGLLVRFASGASIIDNVIVDATLDSSVLEHYQGGMIADNRGVTTVKNCIVKTNALVDGQGIVVGRFFNGSITVTNSYLVADAGVGSSAFGGNTAATDFNTSVASMIYTNEAFAMAITGGSVTLSAWQLAEWNAL